MVGVGLRRSFPTDVAAVACEREASPDREENPANAPLAYVSGHSVGPGHHLRGAREWRTD